MKLIGATATLVLVAAPWAEGMVRTSKSRTVHEAVISPRGEVDQRTHLNDNLDDLSTAFSKAQGEVDRLRALRDERSNIPPTYGELDSRAIRFRDDVESSGRDSGAPAIAKFKVSVKRRDPSAPAAATAAAPRRKSVFSFDITTTRRNPHGESAPHPSSSESSGGPYGEECDGPSSRSSSSREIPASLPSSSTHPGRSRSSSKKLSGGKKSKSAVSESRKSHSELDARASVTYSYPKPSDTKVKLSTGVSSYYAAQSSDSDGDSDSEVNSSSSDSSSEEDDDDDNNRQRVEDFEAALQEHMRGTEEIRDRYCNNHSKPCPHPHDVNSRSDSTMVKLPTATNTGVFDYIGHKYGEYFFRAKDWSSKQVQVVQLPGHILRISGKKPGLNFKRKFSIEPNCSLRSWEVLDNGELVVKLNGC